MKLSVRFLTRVSGETGFRPDVLEKVVRLGALAGEIRGHPLLGEHLLLKGGTPLNLGFGSPQRLSVDLDYNYIGALDREQMQVERPRVESAMSELAGRLGYRVQKSSDAHAGRAYYLSYQRADGGPDRIEVDLNFLFRSPVGTPRSMELWQPEGMDRPSVLAVSDDELCIGKFLAFFGRTAPRDAWDVARLSEIHAERLTSKIFRARMIAMSAILNHPIDSYDLPQVERRMTERAVMENLWPMLAQRAQPGAAELRKRAWAVAEPFTRLTDSEKAFVDQMMKGALRIELLSQDAAVASELEEHPALQWKLHNIQMQTER